MVDRYNNGRYSGRNAQNRCGVNSQNTRNRCECNNGKCGELLQKLKEVDFYIIDVVLYLDAYPCNKEALKLYRSLQCERAEIINRLSNECDMPITIFDNDNVDKWTWTDAPWPWEICAN